MLLSQKEDHAAVWLVSWQLESYTYEKVNGNKGVTVTHYSAAEGERWRHSEVLPPERMKAFCGGYAGASKLIFSRDTHDI